MVISRPPRMSAARMYERVLAGDPTWNGRFFTGVLTTGIYCLPSCKARKPKLENVRFFNTCEEARKAGLRPCKKCHPDDFEKGADPVLEAIEALVAEVRKDPAGFSDARAIVKRSGFGATRAFELLRQHYHATPADLLLRARLDRVKHELISSTKPLTEIAYDAGFESLSVLHENFRAFNGMTPGSYRDLKRTPSFELTLPDGFLMGYLRRALSRDKDSITEKLEGDLYTTALQLSSGPTLVHMRFDGSTVRVEHTSGAATEVHGVVTGLLGLDQNAPAFARLAKSLGLSRLIAGREELRITRTASVFDGLLWSIIGQQINLAFACTLRRRLVQHAGTPMDEDLVAPPRPEAVAALSAAELLPLQFSRQKAEYVVATARLITEGKLDLDSLRHQSATRAERTLMSVRGLGPWSVNYVMMRALGFADCVPLGDTGVTSGLQSLLKLEQRPDVDATRRLMAVFSPHRSLATAHLWQLNQPIPT